MLAPSARTATRHAREHPALLLAHVGQRRQRVLLGHALERVGQRGARTARRGSRCARTQRSIAARPGLATHELRHLHRRDGQRERRARGRTRARRPRWCARAGRARARATRARPRARGRSRARSRHGRAPPGRAPRGRCRRRRRAARRRARAASSRQRSRSAAYDAHSTSCQITASSTVLSPTTAWPGRGPPAGRAARAAPCRWAARTAAAPSPPATAESSERPSSRSTVTGASTPAYLSRSAISSARVPVHVIRRARPASSSKSASQIHEMSRPSAMPSLSAIQRSSAPSSSVSVRSTSFAPAGFFTSRIASSRPSTWSRSTRPKAAANSRQRVAHLAGRCAQLERRGRGRQRVVDVVEAGEGEAQLDRPGRAWRCARRSRTCPRSVTRSAATCGFGPLAPAVGAAVAAHVAEVHGLVGVLVAAVAAALRVRGVLERLERVRAVLHAEVHDALALAPQVRHQRVVGVEHERGAPVALCHQLRPAVGQQLQLAVAVELVAEQVGQQDQAAGRGRAPRGRATPRPPRTARSAPASGRRRAARWRRPSSCSSRRGCAPPRAPAVSSTEASIAEVVVLPLVAETTTEPRSSRLPSTRDRARVEPQQHAAGQRGAAAAPQPAAQHAQRARERRACRRSITGAITRSACFETVTVTGRSAIGSPSA